MSRKIQQVSYAGEVGELLKTYFTEKTREGYVLVGDEEVIMPLYYEGFMQDINELEVFDSDVFVASHPKAGKFELF